MILEELIIYFHLIGHEHHTETHRHTISKVI
jgi:hypothetical protein